MERVIVNKLMAPHQTESFTRHRPLGRELRAALDSAVADIFDALGGPALLKSSGEVYIKPNAVDARPYCHTRPEAVEAVIRYWQKAGARRVLLCENATQGNYTRLVFAANGYARICRRTGAVPVYLDEEKTETFRFTGRKTVDEKDPGEYEQPEFRLPLTVARKLIRERDAHLYINLPKLKTHSMGTVTLGIKNQWGFPVHGSRGADHNFNLHRKLADVLAVVTPDVTLIEGVEGVIHGHYAPVALADACIKPFGVMIGSANVLAADIVGSKVLGFNADAVAHIRIALGRGLGKSVQGPADITLEGDIHDFRDLNILGDRPDDGHYAFDLIDRFPPDVRIVTGGVMACREGCVNNAMTLMQVLYLDHKGRGGWTLVNGKGHDDNRIDSIRGRVLVAGPCAVKETAERLIRRLGRRNVYISGVCNDLCALAEAMFHLMKVNPMACAPINPLSASWVYLRARIAGSNSRVPHPFSHLFKRV